MRNLQWQKSQLRWFKPPSPLYNQLHHWAAWTYHPLSASLPWAMLKSWSNRSWTCRWLQRLLEDLLDLNDQKPLLILWSASALICLLQRRPQLSPVHQLPVLCFWQTSHQHRLWLLSTLNSSWTFSSLSVLNRGLHQNRQTQSEQSKVQKLIPENSLKQLQLSS